MKRIAPILDINEIKDAEQFENLTAAFFRSLKNGMFVKVEQSGKGPDGGRDILVTFNGTDQIDNFTRKWVIQCKFHSKSVNRKHLADVNIPTLIHQYGADGYLLICKNGVTSKLTEMFESLNKNCKFHYNYKIWNGEELKSKLYVYSKIQKQFFPKYFAMIKEIKRKKQ